MRIHKVILLCGLAAAVSAESWGNQQASLSKNSKTVDATQTGGSRGGGNFKANAANKAAITANAKGRGYKTGLVGQEAQAGSGSQTENVAKGVGGNDFEAKNSAGKKATVDTTGNNQAKIAAPDRNGRDQQILTNLKGTDTEARIASNGQKYNANYNKAGDTFEVKDRTGKELANGKVVSQGRDTYNIPIQQENAQVIANSKKVGRTNDAGATIRDPSKRTNAKYFSKTSDGSVSKTEIGTSNILSGSAYTEVDKQGKESRMGGSLVKGPVVKFKDRGSQDKDCPKPRSGVYEWQGKYKIDTKNVKARPPTADESGGNVRVKWPDCVTMEVPMTFPAGTKIEDLAVSLKVVMPGCNQLMCAGYVCGNPTTAQLGAAEETCWEDNLCKYQPPQNNDKGSVIGSVLKNSKNDACTQGYNGGPITVKFTFCAMNDDRVTKEKHCVLANLFELMGDTPEQSQIMAVTTVYEKKNKGGSSGGGLFGQVSNFLNGGITKALTQCNKADYDAKGCHELTQDYQMSAFGISQDTHSFMKTGINRAGGSGSSNVRTNTNVQTNTNTNTNVRPVTQRPVATTRRSVFGNLFTQAPSTGTQSRPWWQGRRR